MGALLLPAFAGASSFFVGCGGQTVRTSRVHLHYNYVVDAENGIVLKNPSYHKEGYGTIAIDGVEYPIHFWFGDGVLILDTKQEFGFPPTEDGVSNTVFLEYVEPNVLRSTKPATIFGRVYERIELIASNVDMNQFKPYEFVQRHKMWRSDDGKMELLISDDFNVYRNVHRFYLSAYAGYTGLFSFGSDLTFKAAFEEDAAASWVASGTYDGSGPNATLTFAADSIWGYAPNAKVNLSLVYSDF